MGNACMQVCHILSLIIFQMGWLMVKKHPDVIKTGSTIDLSDLQADPVVMFQHKYYVPSVILLCFLLPTLIPVLCWEESLHVAFFIAMFRYIFSLHPVWLVNSAAHMYGNRPYDTKIAPADNFLVAFLGFGGGFHNFHHTFPYDYRASEWGNFINPTKVFIDLMAFVGLAYDLKQVTNCIFCIFCIILFVQDSFRRLDSS